MIGFFDLLAGFVFKFFERERDLFSFDKKFFEVHEIEKNKHRHPYIVLTIFLKFFQCVYVIFLNIFLI